MPQVLVQILSIDKENFPGFAEFKLTDIKGKVHSFHEKLPVIGIDIEKTPYAAWIECVVLEKNQGSVLISTKQPTGIQSTTSQSEFEVSRTSLR